MTTFPPCTSISIAGAAAAFPSDVGIGESLDNADVYRRILGRDADAEILKRGWDVRRPEAEWGVRRRQWVHRDRDGASDVVDLGAHAVDRALANAGLEPRDVDLLIASTSTPDRITSVMAASIGKLLGIESGCVDVRAGGAGGIDAWMLASGYLSETCGTVVVVAAEAPSRFVSHVDPAAAALYGDGAAALVMRYDAAADGGLVCGFMKRADALGTPFTVPGPLPPTAVHVEAGRYLFQKPDPEYLDGLARAWDLACVQLRRELRTVGVDVDVFVPYAITSQQVRAASTSAGVSPGATFDTLADHGCLGCAGPLVSVATLMQQGSLAPGLTVASVAVAGGVTVGGMAWRV